MRLTRLRLQLRIGIPHIAIRLAQTANADTYRDRLASSILLPLLAKRLVLLPEALTFAPQCPSLGGISLPVGLATKAGNLSLEISHQLL
jgi:hypothetical protein